jgi:hypothetical protein
MTMGQAHNQSIHAQGQQSGTTAETSQGGLQQSYREKGSFGAGSIKGTMPNKEYNLVSVLYHALQAAETCGQYIQDAQNEGDEELVKFFHEVQAKQVDLAQRTKQCLGKRIGAGYEPDQQRARS